MGVRRWEETDISIPYEIFVKRTSFAISCEEPEKMTAHVRTCQQLSLANLNVGTDRV